MIETPDVNLWPLNTYMHICNMYTHVCMYAICTHVYEHRQVHNHTPQSNLTKKCLNTQGIKIL